MRLNNATSLSTRRHLQIRLLRGNNSFCQSRQPQLQGDNPVYVEASFLAGCGRKGREFSGKVNSVLGENGSEKVCTDMVGIRPDVWSALGCFGGELGG